LALIRILQAGKILFSVRCLLRGLQEINFKWTRSDGPASGFGAGNRSMKKLLVVILCVLILAAAAFVAGARITGGKAQEEWRKGIEAVSIPGAIEIKPLTYQRGWFSSTATSALIFHDPKRTYTLTLDHHIHHGPLVLSAGGAPIPATALIDTSAFFSKEKEPQLFALLGDTPLVTARSRINFDGSIQSHVVCPKRNVPFRDSKSAVDWKGAEGDVDVSSGYKRVTFSLTAPDLSVYDGISVISAQQGSINGSFTPSPSRLWLGEIHSDLKSFDIKLPMRDKSEEFHMKDMSLSLTAKEQDGQVVWFYTMRMGAASSGDEFVNQGLCEIELGLNAEATGMLLSALSSLNIGPDRKGDVDEKAIIKALDALDTLLKKEPRFDIKQFAFSSKEGKTTLKALFTLNQDKPFILGDWQTMLSNLRVDAEINTPVALTNSALTAKFLNDLERLPANTQGLGDEKSKELMARNLASQWLAKIEEKGLLKRQGEDYAAKITLENGVLSSNGVPVSEVVN